MGSVVLTSYGTLGDHFPLLALGQALQSRGKQVRAAFNEAMVPHAQKAGLEPWIIGLPPLGREQASQAASSWDHLQTKEMDKTNVKSLLRQYYLPCMSSLMAACSGADLIVTTPQSYPPAFVIGKKLSIPCVCVTFSPLPYLCSSKNKDKIDLGEVRYMLSPLLDYVDLSSLSREDLKNSWPPEESLLAASPGFYQLPTELSSRLKEVGFWFYDEPMWQNWQPDDDLQNFFSVESKPLVLTFSSLPVEDSKAVVETHARAASLIGRRLVIQQGWAGLNIHSLSADIDRDQLMSVGFMPQDWLFSHAAAVIHHGGIGTTARALRNGCPMVVEPYGNDQFLNAQQALGLGVGVAVHPHLLTAETLAQVLEEKALTSAYRSRAEQLKTQILSDSSLETSCQYIEKLL